MFLPLNSLVIDFTKKEYESIEALSFKKIKNMIFNDSELYESDELIFDLMLEIIIKKLKAGERIILFDTKNNLFFERRKTILNSIKNLTNNIFYIVPEDIKDRNIMFGDNQAQVIKDKKVWGFVEKLNHEKLINHIKNYKKITIVGDVHGQYESLLSVIDWSKKMNSFLIFLGDIIDYGPKSIECLEEIYNLLIRNQTVLILGNHERKLFRWLEKNKNQKSKLFLSESNKQTINKINSLSENERKLWTNKFKTTVQLSKTHLIFDNLILVHAAYDKEMMNFKNYNFLPRNLENIALLGKNFVEENELITNRDWIKEIAGEYKIFVGHENSKNIKPPIIKQNNSEIYFMDTGSGKGGNLSSVDLIYKENKWEILNFNSW